MTLEGVSSTGISTSRPWDEDSREKRLLGGVSRKWSHGAAGETKEDGAAQGHGIRLGSWFGGDGHGQEWS